MRVGGVICCGSKIEMENDMKNKLWPLALVTTVTLAMPALAEPLLVATSKTTTKGFVGLQWTFGSNATRPEAVIGLAYGKVDHNGDLTGAKASMHFSLSDVIAPAKVKLTGLVGESDVQAEIGLGYDLDGQAFFGVGGLNTQYFSGGADIDFSGGLEGYIGLHSIGEFDKPAVVLPPA